MVVWLAGRLVGQPIMRRLSMCVAQHTHIQNKLIGRRIGSARSMARSFRAQKREPATKVMARYQQKPALAHVLPYY